MLYKQRRSVRSLLVCLHLWVKTTYLYILDAQTHTLFRCSRFRQKLWHDWINNLTSLVGNEAFCCCCFVDNSSIPLLALWFLVFKTDTRMSPLGISSLCACIYMHKYVHVNAHACVRVDTCTCAPRGDWFSALPCHRLASSWPLQGEREAVKADPQVCSFDV